MNAEPLVELATLTLAWPKLRAFLEACREVGYTRITIAEHNECGVIRATWPPGTAEPKLPRRLCDDDRFPWPAIWRIAEEHFGGIANGAGGGRWHTTQPDPKQDFAPGTYNLTQPLAEPT